MRVNESKRIWVVFWRHVNPLWNIESCFEEKEDAEARIAELDYRWPDQEHKMERLRVFVSSDD